MALGEAIINGSPPEIKEVQGSNGKMTKQVCMFCELFVDCVLFFFFAYFIYLDEIIMGAFVLIFFLLRYNFYTYTYLQYKQYFIILF